MRSFFETGVSWLQRKGEELDRCECIYDTGSIRGSISALRGRSQYQIDTGTEVRVLTTDRDFLVSQDALQHAVQITDPVAGHRIYVNGTNEIYEVLPIPGGQCFERDQFNVRLRIHTKRVQ
jgi:hypothetical protein